ncbi:MAG TPA: hypothetical protein VGF04_10550 [Solirubrobacterales bacterium]
MISLIRKKLTCSNAIAGLALFVALGGVAVAANLPKNSVGPKQLKNGAVTAKKLRREAVGNRKLAPGAVSAAKLAGGAVTASKLANGAVHSGALANGAVINSKIANGVVGTNKLGNEVVTTSKLAKEDVTTDKIKNGAVTGAKLGTDVGPFAGSNLHSGQTLRGQFAVGGASGAPIWTAQSFAFPLAEAPKAEVIDPATATTSNCPGITGASGQNPGAAGGFLCLYVTSKANVAVGGVTVPGVALTRLGFAIEGNAEAGGPFTASGQWAVTAP